ncbi:MAG: D-alanyl-lipoteichoic acid biosynthesis protein DltB [Liquorilactobacillus nagelii]|uniref:Teichoic acid D-alanyltransferase n=1 Tax=Liquorilactobacillus nagelii TaxID=82688 RepID=A0A3S6QWN9_9LACO|nr:D-alanyl-lipoteichoic acid biosynthesis protein DltB [Liquorilactobacillus nagelii]AUJ32606.1 D-alanyl-lipoteichoic acid biosynthesis protein DltB [Liquorilactobacillus nagelii]KRL42435.1 D-alanine transfer protein DltB [Liquorilactobacillus nagelii DSM 13675]MCC7616763.1 D-alanyl-lipoteichoic acid biosynthesis protein DltB [Liquorilactobacillus nagelii]MCI1634207.1 D-alanyl-lipoteichoic acid biosynthesis protein DltB [Liquorilactobacillus nagelii]MCI1921345.1 D-alanyl-lipoteichoic acid bio
MIDILNSLPNLKVYGTPIYFIYLLLAITPLVISLYFGKRLVKYEVLVNIVFIYLMFDASSWPQLIALIAFLAWQTILVLIYFKYRKKANNNLVFYLWTLLLLIPIIIVKVTPAVSGKNSLIGFLGISYLTFRAVGTLIEIRDGAIKEFNTGHFIRFMAFMPAITSGPIDRFRRFEKDYQKVPDRQEYLGMVDKAVHYLFLGFLYKFVLSYFLGSRLLPMLEAKAMFYSPHFTWYLVGVMYVYGLYLFFDFAGYSLFAVAISYLMGVKTPMNFNKPFLSKNIKEFWNRWHMTLSFWFRDYIFMRFVFTATRHKWIKNRNTLSSLAYLLNMFVMGCWHGLTWYYILYGLMHGLGLIINDWWLRLKKKHLKWLPHNKFTEFIAIVITFNFVMLSFLLFSGFLNRFWFGGKF